MIDYLLFKCIRTNRLLGVETDGLNDIDRWITFLERGKRPKIREGKIKERYDGYK